MAGTPYIAMPGRPLRTPVGTRGWDTPGTTRRHRLADFDILDEAPACTGQTTRKRQRRVPPVRDDLSLDAFQRNFTSEDNASFVQILDEENRRKREEKFGWAFEAERNAEARRIEGEVKRKMILDTATSGRWRVDANGRRLIGALAEGSDRADGEAWDVKMIQPKPETEEPGAIHPTSPTSSSALVKLSSSSDAPPPLTEIPLPPKHPLAEALADAGLPPTALISSTDGKIVPHHETASGGGSGGALTVFAPHGDRGRGDDERKEREKRERQVLGEEKAETLSAAGSGVDMWKYKVGPFTFLFFALFLMDFI